MFRKNKITTIRRLLPFWYSAHKRSLPWRGTRDPYRILVSETMLQQTQVSRVLQKYPLFLKQFPTMQSLAKASTADVIRAWRGMGYNNRAVRLRNFAREVTQRHGGRIPPTIKNLLSLPGIGTYTAHALACFAFRQDVPVVDVNVTRVLSRLFWPMNGLAERKDSDMIWRLSKRILPRGKAYDWNQALMDLGATICTARKPSCNECPVSGMCSSLHTIDRSKVGGPTKGRSKERLYDSLPLRIYRGRVVEQLRRLNGRRSLDAPTLGKLIKPNFTRRELPWLRGILQKLEREGLVGIRSENGSILAQLPES